MPDLQQAVPVTADTDASTAPATSRAERMRDRVTALPKRTAFWIGVIDVLLVLFFWAASKNHVFLSLNNFQNVTLDAAEITLLSAGEALLLGAGLIDISLPATLILASVAGGRVLVALSGTSAQVQAGVYPHLALGIVACVVVCVGVGALVGLVNGLVVTRLKVNSLIATLAVWSAALGLAQVVSGATDVAYIPTALQSHFGDANLFGVIPYPVFLVGVLVFGMWWALTKTKFGIRTLAIGSSREAAVRAGLRVERQELALLVLVGALAGVAGFLDLSHFADTNISGHTADALEAISGAVIGGTSLFGGVASIGGAVLGALLAQILNSGLVVLNVQPYYQLIVIGVVLVAAVYFDSRRRKAR